MSASWDEATVIVADTHPYESDVQVDEDPVGEGVAQPDRLLAEATAMAQSLADGPTFGHAMTKTMLWQEWSSGLGECIEAEAQAQAICMLTQDFTRAYEAFAAKQKPRFEGN